MYPRKTIEDILDITSVKLFLKCFAKKSNLRVQLLTVNNNRILCSFNQRIIYKDFIKANSCLYNLCDNFIKQSEKKCRTDECKTIVECPFGFICSIIPIKFKAELIGLVQVGCVLFNLPSPTKYLEMAAQYNVDPKNFLENIYKIPIYKREDYVEYIELLVSHFTALVSTAEKGRVLPPPVEKSDFNPAKIPELPDFIAQNLQKRMIEIQELADNVNKKERFLKQRLIGRTLEIKKKNEELYDLKNRITQLKKEYQAASSAIIEANHAMAALARNIETEKKSLLTDVSNKVCSKIIPIINLLKSNVSNEEHKADLEMISLYLRDLIPDFSDEIAPLLNLTPMELKIASMVKNGLKTSEIAETLNVSIDTVKTHRKNIRKKIQISGTNISLTTYLKKNLNDQVISITNGNSGHA